MRHEPSALVRDSEHPVKLVRAHALLAGAQETINHLFGGIRLSSRTVPTVTLNCFRQALQLSRPRRGPLVPFLMGQPRGFVQDAAMRAWLRGIPLLYQGLESEV